MILSALQDFYHFRPNAEPQFIEYEFLLNYQKIKMEKKLSVSRIETSWLTAMAMA